MAAGVFEQWFIDLSIAGTPLAADPYNTSRLDIISNIHQHLPSIYISHRDPTGDNSELFRFKDGDPISISVGVPGIHIYDAMNFMVIGNPTGDPTKTEGVTINGVLNSPSWLRKVADTHTEGTSSDVFSKFASQAGLKPITHSASDSMTWLPNRTSFAEYTRFVADRAYAGGTSCFITGVMDNHNAYFKNVEQIMQGGATRLFSQFYEEGSINVLNYSVASKTHIANNSRGYGATSMATKNDGSVVELNKIDMTSFVSSLPFGSFLPDAIGDLGNRIMQLPMLPGNTHDKWAEAIHQNMRIKSLYAFDVHVLTDTPARVELLDKVQFRPMNRQTGQPVDVLVGDYMITAVTKTITGGRYYEKYTLTSQGPQG